jgi:hypothetical protein
LPVPRQCFAVMGIWWLLTTVGQACSVPVFRYALERWRADPYEVLVYYRGALTAEHEQLLDRLNPEYVPGEPFPNAAVSRINLDGDVRPEFAAIWDEERREILPWIVLRTPWRGDNETVWRGPLTADSVAAILNSPLRAEIVRRLIAGDSIVWVFLGGSDPEQEDTLAELCAARLADLQDEIQLPEIRPEDLAELSVQPEQLRLKFSLLRVDRASMEEAVLVQSLLAVQPDLKRAELASEPLLFPVFGRGRVFFPLVGEQIDAAHLEELARFLCGACQCTIKQQNPGIDLLTPIDWDAYVLGTVVDRPLPPLTGLGEFAPPVRTETAASADVIAAPSPPPNSDGPPRSRSTGMTAPPAAGPAAVTPAAGRSVGAPLLWTAVGLTLLVVCVSLWSTVRRREGPSTGPDSPRTTEHP